MIVVNENYEIITDYDLNKGFLNPIIIIDPNADPIDGKTKTAWADEDYIDAKMYILKKPDEATNLDRLEAQTVYTAMKTGTLLEE